MQINITASFIYLLYIFFTIQQWIFLPIPPLKVNTKLLIDYALHLKKLSLWYSCITSRCGSASDQQRSNEYATPDIIVSFLLFFTIPIPLHIGNLAHILFLDVYFSDFRRLISATSVRTLSSWARDGGLDCFHLLSHLTYGHNSTATKTTITTDTGTNNSQKYSLNEKLGSISLFISGISFPMFYY